MYFIRCEKSVGLLGDGEANTYPATLARNRGKTEAYQNSKLLPEQRQGRKDIHTYMGHSSVCMLMGKQHQPCHHLRHFYQLKKICQK